MKKKIKIFVDIHKYGTYDLGIPLEYGKDCYYLGDNLDLAHCPVDAVPDVFRELRETHRRFGERFVRGNHELNLVSAPDFIVVGDTVLCHGDQIFWSPRWAAQWRRQSPGRGPLSRLATEGTVDFLRHLIPEPVLNLEQKCRTINISFRHNRKRIICAHRHPVAVCQFRPIHDLEVICLPRGVSEVEVEI